MSAVEPSHKTILKDHVLRLFIPISVHLQAWSPVRSASTDQFLSKTNPTREHFKQSFSILQNIFLWGEKCPDSFF